MKKNWLDDIAEKTYEHYEKRKIVLWGKYSVSDSIQEILIERYGIEAAFYVDGNIEKIDNYQVFPTDFLAGKSKDYYVVIPLAFYQSLKDELTLWGYEKDIDYYYFADCIVQQTSDYYEDLHGNKIIGTYHRGGVKFAFSGFDSTIIIGEQVHFYESMIYVHNDVRITLGDYTDLAKSTICAYDNAQITIEDRTNIRQSIINMDRSSDIVIEEDCCISRLSIIMNSKAGILLRKGIKVLYGGSWQIFDQARVEIGNRGNFGKGTLMVEKEAQIIIGDDFSINSTYQITATAYTSITVGDDCMVSYDVVLHSNDSHSIFDINTGKNTNSTKEISKLRKIVIGNHVWLGVRSIVLYNSEIGNGSIIGAASLVKGKIPNNCIAVGIPAKVKKENVAWEREAGVESFREKWDYRNEVQ